MHILVDLRTTSLSDIPFLHYGLLWIDAWKTYHPHDTITILAHDGDPIEKHKAIFVPRRWQFQRKKIAHHNHGPVRTLSFSRLPPYDESIPQISHVFDLSPLLYPVAPLGFLEHRMIRRNITRLLEKSERIILPDPEVGMSISEIFSCDEQKFMILPHLFPIHREMYRLKTILPQGVFGKYFLTEGTPSEEWRPIRLLESFAQYIHEYDGNAKLIIIGDLGNNMGNILTTIRSLDLMKHVKLVGVLNRDDRESLYAQAFGWIYAGSYYTRGPSVGLAAGYEIPLFYTDITGLRHHEGNPFHPNHLEDLPRLLARHASHLQDDGVSPNNENIMLAYARILAE